MTFGKSQDIALPAGESRRSVGILLLTASVLFILPLAYWPSLFEAATVPRYFLLGLLVPVAWMLLAWPIRPVMLHWHPAVWSLMFLLTWSACSLVWTSDPGMARIRFVSFTTMIGLCLLGLQLAQKDVLHRWLFPAILLGAGAALLIGLGQHFGFNPLKFRLQPGQMPSTFINRNHAANFFDFITPLALFAILAYRSPFLRWFSAIVLGLVLAYITLNQSRGTILALIAGSLILGILLLTDRKLRQELKNAVFARRRELLVAILLAIVLVLLPSTGGVAERWHAGLLQGELDSSSQYRLAMYMNALPVFLDHPLGGTGIGGIRIGMLPHINDFMSIGFRTEDIALQELHNDFLQYFVELGIPGGIAFIVILFLALRAGWRASRAATKSTDRWGILALGFAVAISALHGLVDFPQRLPSSAALFWLFIGLLLGFSPESQIWRPTGTLGRTVRAGLFLVSAFALLFSVLFHSAWFAGNHNLYQAAYHLQKGQCIPAAEASRKGLETFPGDYKLKTVHAQIYTACSFPPERKLAEMNRIIAMDPTIFRARLTRAILFNQARRPDLSIPELKAVARSLPQRPTAYAALGDAMLQQGNSLYARDFYRAALERKPDYNYVKKRLQQLATRGK